MEYTAAQPHSCSKALYTTLTGLSPLAAEEICYRASLDSDQPINTMSEVEKLHLYGTLRRTMEDVLGGCFCPNVITKDDIPEEFASLELTHLLDSDAGYECEEYEDVSLVLQTFYATRSAVSRIRQKSVDLRRVVTTALERNVKKYDLQQKQMKDTEKREKFRIYGELIEITFCLIKFFLTTSFRIIPVV